MAAPLALKMLNTLLASEYVLLVRTRAAHWNVVDDDFGPLHALFGSQYSELAGLADTIAERVRQLDGVALGSMREFIDQALIGETSSSLGSGKEFGSNLVEMHSKLIAKMRRMIDHFDQIEKDTVTSNLLQDWTATHEKMLWFLKAHKFGAA